MQAVTRRAGMESLIIGVMLIVILSVTILGMPYLEEKAIVNAVNSLGKVIQEGQIEKASKMFIPDAVFIHKESQSTYIGALDALSEKVKKGIINGTLYVYKIKEKTKSKAYVLNVAWFNIKNKSYEASGIIELQKVGLWKWRIKKISSETWAFGNVYFDKE